MTKHGPRVFEVFLRFLKLGCTAFGGPVAHLGYFHEEFVNRRRWVSDAEYADLVALCQFLPGPASSQVGFSIGLKVAGIPGAFAAWLGFTLPSAVIMIALAIGLPSAALAQHSGWIDGLKLAAVAVVADAIWNMAARLCPDAGRALIALMGGAFLLMVDNALWQAGVIAAGALVGGAFFRGKVAAGNASASWTAGVPGWPFLAAFFLLLGGLPLLAGWCPDRELRLVQGFFQTGSLVFGGGHVILPLLDSVTVGPGLLDRNSFLAGYGAAQALPGPLFTFAGFLGAALSRQAGPVLGGVVAILAIFLPSWLLILGTIPYWNRLRGNKIARALLMGANAAVVGLLIAAFYNPMWVSTITGPDRLAFALVAFGLLRFAKAPPWALVVASSAAGALLFR